MYAEEKLKVECIIISEKQIKQKTGGIKMLTRPNIFNYAKKGKIFAYLAFYKFLIS